MALVANGEPIQLTQSSMLENTPASNMNPENPTATTDRTEQFNASPARQRELEIASAAALKSEEYRQLFRLPPGEVLLQDFNCALQENMIYQGHMYLFPNYVCFYSNIFGFETKKVIPFGEITLLKRAKTAGIFPSAIEIFTGEQKHFFSSFLSRDEAFNLISDLWPERESKSTENSLQQVTHVPQESPSGSSVPCKKSLPIDSIESSSIFNDDLNSVARISSQEVPITNDSESVPIVEDRSRPIITPSEQQENEEVTAQVTNTSSPPTARGIVLKQEDTEAPKVSEEFVKVAEARFPIKVDDFFRFFFSDTTFIEYFRKCCGDTDFKCSAWSPSEEFGHVREVSFLHPIKFYLGAKSGGCKETQKIQAYRDSRFVVQTSQEVNGVPFADYFTVEGLWDVENDVSGEACVMKVYVNVVFSKRTMWKGKIVQSTMDECRDVFATWINIAHELLQKKKLEKEELSNHSVDGDILDNSGRKAEIKETSRILLPQTSEQERLPLLFDADKHLQGTENEKSSDATSSCSPSSFGGKFAKLFGLKGNQGYLPHLLVVTVLVVLMMQLTIVLLLSRPPQVQPVYPMDYFSGMNQGLHPSPQELVWMEKRVHHLKQEMLMVETRLERMRLEHKHLKSQLKDFEHFSAKFE